MVTTNETHIPPSTEGRERDHSAVQSEPRSGLSGTRSAIDDHEVALDLEWTRLKEELPKAEAAKRLADAHVKNVKVQLEVARQLVAHHRRLSKRFAR